MSNTVRALFWAPVVCLSAGAALLAQQQRPTFRSDAHFVLVDAYPVRAGKVIAGLTAADFEVREDGAPQRIETFEFVDAGAPEPESARRDPNTITESRTLVADARTRAFVVDLDIDHVSIEGARHIRAPLIEMLNRVIGASDLFAVTSSKHDPATLTFARKILTVEDMLTRYWAWGTRNSPILDPEEAGIRDCFGWEATPRGPVERTSEDGARVRKLVDLILERRRESKMLDHLEDLVDVLGQLREGRTSVVLVTEGWRLFRPDAALTKEVDETQHGAPEGPVALGGQLMMLNKLEYGDRQACLLEGMKLAREDNQSRLRDLIERANSRNVSFIPVNPIGLAGFDSPMSEQITPVDDMTRSVLADDFGRIAARTNGLIRLAVNTDGMAVVNTNDLSAGLGRVTDQLRSFYLLGYYSTNTTFNGRIRHITVKANDGGGEMDVRARRGYRAPTEEERALRANPVAAAGPSNVERAMDVLSGIRSASDRTFNASRYLKADAAPILGVPAVFRATPSPRSPLVPVTAPAFTRRERLHIEWPVTEALTERSARLLGRNSQPLAVNVTLTERDGASGPIIVADATLAALAPGDYVVELRVTAGSGTKASLVAFRVVP